MLEITQVNQFPVCRQFSQGRRQQCKRIETGQHIIFQYQYLFPPLFHHFFIYHSVRKGAGDLPGIEGFTLALQLFGPLCIIHTFFL